MTNTNNTPVTLAFDIDDFTLEEMEIIEVQGETPLTDMGTALASLGEERAPGAPKPPPITKLLRALAYIALLRQNPKATWEETGKIKFTELLNGMTASDSSDGELPPPLAS